jgi:hypothetical protein
MDFAQVLAVYTGSDGDATKALYARLGAFGPAGAIAVELFRTQKASARAKVYRGGERGRGSYRRMAYDRKGWAMDNLVAALGEHGHRLGIGWGWGEDPARDPHRHVLYVDLPTGQVSFHSAARRSGPDYAKSWDGQRGAVPSRICRWIADLFAAGEPNQGEPHG